MGDLTHYIFHNYSRLMTIREHAAYRSVLGEEKARNSDSPEAQNMLRRAWVSSDPHVLELLAEGPEPFMANVRDRILRDHSDQVFVNRCPKCASLARTPAAKQCPKCFFNWHDTV